MSTSQKITLLSFGLRKIEEETSTLSEEQQLLEDVHTLEAELLDVLGVDGHDEAHVRQELARLSTYDEYISRTISNRAILALDSPIFSFPFEIICEVLAFYVSDRYASYPKDNVQNSVRWAQTELQGVMSVCRRWRLAALNDPRLWTDIGIECACRSNGTRLERDLRNGLSPEQSRAQYWDAWERRLQRAGPLPLSVHFYHLVGYHECNDKPFTMYEKLLRIIPRTIYLNFQLSSSVTAATDIAAFLARRKAEARLSGPEALFGPLETTRYGRARALEGRFSVAGSAGTAVGRELIDLLGNVQEATFHTGEVFNKDPAMIQDVLVPSTGSSLRQFIADGIAFLQLLQLLEGAPALESIFIRGLDSDWELNPQSQMYPTTVHRHLRHLHLGLTFATEESDIFEFITLPGLQELECDFVSNASYNWPSSKTIAFFRRSGCRLRSLVVKSARDLNDEPLLEILSTQRKSIEVLHLGPAHDLRAPVFDNATERAEAT